MNERDFCFWLQGLLEVGKPTTLNAEQVALIKDHLDLVFVHATPDDIKKAIDHVQRKEVFVPQPLKGDGHPFDEAMRLRVFC